MMVIQKPNRKPYLSILFSVFISLVLILQSCENNTDNILPSSNALEYLDEALDIMEYNSVNRKEIEWDLFREKIIIKAGFPQNSMDTYPAIEYALESLNDHHSFFMTPAELSQFETANSDTILPILDTKLISNVGYIKIPGFSGDSIKSLRFAQQIQSEIKGLDNDSIRGWIVDLRDNSGGNMWPMLTGVGPILGEGLAGYFIDPDNHKIEWGYYDGASWIDDFIIIKLDNAYSLLSPNPKVAILTNKLTASSGEAIVVAFKGRDNTKSFGAPTYGVSTANSRFNMSDGAAIILTVSTFADRNGILYGQNIEPDQSTTYSLTLNTAIEWLSY